MGKGSKNKKRGAKRDTRTRGYATSSVATAASGPEPETHIEPDRLRRFFADTRFARAVLEKLDTDGYCVLPAVFSTAEADAALDLMWAWVEKTSPSVARAEPASWKATEGAEPWPHAQHDMMQLHQAGWLLSDLREAFAERVFAPLYGTRALHASKDGFTLQRPTEAELHRPANDHFDQGAALLGLQCVQGSVALLDQAEEDGCFAAWPGSHREHAALMRVLAAENPTKANSNWQKLSPTRRRQMNAKGYAQRRLPLRKGDVVLWRSDCMHCGAPPVGARPTFRAVAYFCCMPAALTPEPIYGKKWEAYRQLECGNHWPCGEAWFTARGSRDHSSFKPYFEHPPSLTPWQRQLYGLERYTHEELHGGAPSAITPAEGAVSELAPEPEPELAAAAAAAAEGAAAAVPEVEHGA